MRISDFELERYFARWEFAVSHLLCASDSQAISLAELLALATPEHRKLWDELVLGYTESPGHPLLRAELARTYEGVAAEDVLVFAGAEEAIFILMNVLLGPGDHAIVTWPGYASLYEVARAIGAEVTLLPLEHERGWRLDVERLERAVKASTKLIVINSPHNPTGAMLDRESFDAVIRIGERAGAHVFSDEVYRWLELDDAERLPAGVECSPRAISLGVMSKAFGLAGLRIGWLAAKDREVLRRAAAFKDYTTICNAAPSEILALMGLRARETLFAQARDRIRTNLEHLDRFFARAGEMIEWVRPRGGTIGFPKLLRGGPVNELAAELAKEESVLILPGSAYGHPGDHFRLGFGRDHLAEALERFERVLVRRAAR